MGNKRRCGWKESLSLGNRNRAVWSLRLEWLHRGQIFSLEDYAKGFCPYPKRCEATLRSFKHMTNFSECLAG